MVVNDNIRSMEQKVDTICGIVEGIARNLNNMDKAINEQSKLLNEIKNELATVGSFPQPASEPFVKHIHLRGE